MSKFNYVKYDERSEMLQNKFKKMVVDLDAMIMSFPNTHTRYNACAALEVFYMWVGKTIRDDQIQRNGYADLQEERKDG